MFKWLLNFMFPTKEEVEAPGVLIHDFTERTVGHDIAINFRPVHSTAEAVISSLETILVGEIVSVMISEEKVDFFVTEVVQVALMVYRAKLEMVIPYDND